MGDTTRTQFRFGEFIFDRATGELTRAGKQVPLRQQPAELLALLLSQPGQLVSRDAVIKTIWGDRIVEYDLGIKSCVHQLRTALQDDASSPAWIETIPRRGFRFIGRLSSVETSSRTRVRYAATLGVPALTALAAIALLGGAPREGLSISVPDPLISGDDFGDEWSALAATVPLPELRASGGDRLTLSLVGDRVLGVLDRDDHVDSLYAQQETGVSPARVMARSVAASLVRPKGLPVEQLPERVRGQYEQVRHLMLLNTPDSKARATALLDSAARLTPDQPMILGAQSSVLLHSGHVGRARETAARALELDEATAEAHATLGAIAMMIDWKWDTARQSLERAIELAPGWAEPHVWYSFLLSALGRHREAIAHGELAVSLDAVSPVLYGDLGYIYVMAGRYDLAADRCSKTVDLDPANFAGHSCILDARILSGDRAGADESAIKLLGILGEDTEGAPQAPTARIDEVLLERSGEHSYNAIVIHARWGRRAEALSSLENAISVHRSIVQKEPDGMEKQPNTLMLMVASADPRLDVLRDERRFSELMREIGPPPEQQVAANTDLIQEQVSQRPN